VGNRWNRIYVEKTRQHRELSQQAKEVYAFIIGEQTDPAGVVVELREGESVNEAITHALGVPPKSRRRWRGAINDLVRVGFLFDDGGQVILPNWQARQEWGKRNGPKGPVPSPIRKPENGAQIIDFKTGEEIDPFAVLEEDIPF
jgi:hypothetical protein